MLATVGFFVAFEGTASDLNSRWFGATEGKVRELVSHCTQLAGVPYAVFFDEIDSIVQRRGTAGAENKGDALTTLLAALGKPGHGNLHLIGTTNRKSAIDSAVLRPGRVSVTVHVGRLNAQDRWDVLCLQWRKSGLPQDTWSTPEGLQCRPSFTTATQNFTGALVRQAVAVVEATVGREAASGEPPRGPEGLCALLLASARAQVARCSDPDLFDLPSTPPSSLVRNWDAQCLELARTLTAANAAGRVLLDLSAPYSARVYVPTSKGGGSRLFSLELSQADASAGRALALAIGAATEPESIFLVDCARLNKAVDGPHLYARGLELVMEEACTMLDTGSAAVVM